MLTKKQFYLPKRLIGPPESSPADWRTANQKTLERIERLEEYINRLQEAIVGHFNWLNRPGGLNITRALIEECQVRSNLGTAATLYEEGIFTPTLVGQTTAGSQTYSTQTGKYVRIGRVVILHDCQVVLSAKDAAMAGNVLLKGLPYTPAGALSGGLSVGSVDNVNLSAGYTQVALIANTSQAAFSLVESGDNVGGQLIGAAAIGNTTALDFAGVYGV